MKTMALMSLFLLFAAMHVEASVDIKLGLDQTVTIGDYKVSCTDNAETDSPEVYRYRCNCVFTGTSNGPRYNGKIVFVHSIEGYGLEANKICADNYGPGRDGFLAKLHKAKNCRKGRRVWEF